MTLLKRGTPLAAILGLFLSAGAANASLVTFDVTGTGISGTWAVDTATGVVPNSGLHGSANITLTGFASSAEGPVSGNYDTDDNGFFHVFAVLGAAGTGINVGLLIPSLHSSDFIGFTGGTFTDGEIYYNGDNNLPTGLTITLREAGATATPIPTALPLLASGLGVLGLLSWPKKRKAMV